MIEAVVAPRGPYRLRLMAGHWSAPLADGTMATACQRTDGRVFIRAAGEVQLAKARFMLALDDDTTEFHRRFASDALLGHSARALAGWRPLRLPTVAHAALRAMCGQLVDSRRARQVERAILRACGGPVATREALNSLSTAELHAHGLAASRAATLSRLMQSIDLERLRDHPTTTVLARLTRERGVGPWSVGVIALEGLGRYDHGLVGDLGLIKLVSALRGRPAEAHETAELLEPYGEWQGLAGELLLLGWTKGLVPGANPDIARRTRLRARRAA
jgi:AraC family transcriptional regulator, regulatory protein of adaptative response / DNA-3-methyladenine glycosylase II